MVHNFHVNKRNLCSVHHLMHFPCASPDCVFTDHLSGYIMEVFEEPVHSAPAASALLCQKQDVSIFGQYAIMFCTLASELVWNNETLIEGSLLLGHIKDKLVGQDLLSYINNTVHWPARLKPSTILLLLIWRIPCNWDAQLYLSELTAWLKDFVSTVGWKIICMSCSSYKGKKRQGLGESGKITLDLTCPFANDWWKWLVSVTLNRDTPRRFSFIHSLGPLSFQ